MHYNALGETLICGLGGILHIKEGHSLKLLAKLCLGTNSYAKLMDFKLLLLLTLEKGDTRIQINIFL